jgi:nitroreductase
MGIMHEIARAARLNPHHIAEEILFRWSPRVMSGELLAEADLLPLFEAARWAPSGRNIQPWYFYYALRPDRHFESLFCLLSENNQRWCAQAGALLLLVSKIMDGDRFLRSHALDSGMAFQNFAIEATRRDLVSHPIGGFDRSGAEAFLNLGDAYSVEIMIAVGKPGDPAALATDRQVSQRNAIEAFAFRLEA